MAVVTGGVYCVLKDVKDGTKPSPVSV